MGDDAVKAMQVEPGTDAVLVLTVDETAVSSAHAHRRHSPFSVHVEGLSPFGDSGPDVFPSLLTLLYRQNFFSQAVN